MIRKNKDVIDKFFIRQIYEFFDPPYFCNLRLFLTGMDITILVMISSINYLLSPDTFCGITDKFILVED